MTHYTKRELLEQAHLFKGLSAAQIDAIEAVSELTWFDAGTAITVADDWGTAAYLVLYGTVTVADATYTASDDEPLGPGTLIGELAMLTEVTYAATVVAAEPVRALVIEREALYTVLESDPAIAEHMSDKLSARLTELATELRQVNTRFQALETSLRYMSDAA